jgi:hypothetical protein
MRKNHIKVGYLDVPKNYFELGLEDKEIVRNSILEVMLYILERNLSKKTDKQKVLLDVIESSIMMNEQEENYEVSGVLLDIKKMINKEYRTLIRTKTHSSVGLKNDKSNSSSLIHI